MKLKLWIISLCSVILCLAVPAVRSQAQITAEQKTDYTNTLSKLVREGTEKGAVDAYRTLSATGTGKTCLQEAMLMNRAALMAEDIDFMDSGWKSYYKIKKTSTRTVLYTSKAVKRSTYKTRYAKVMEGLEQVLSSVDASMSDADKATAVYTYLCKNTVYRSGSDSHSGYGVLTAGTGVCDGLANAYALAMQALGIPCAVVSNTNLDHSWNITKIGGKWYLSDLTKGVGTGTHVGKVVSYRGNLVGVSSFLSSHSGYEKSDLYGTGNSNGLNIKSLTLSGSDYMSTAMKNGIYSRSCMAYHGGYWYWVSADNDLKRSKLNGSGLTTIYASTDTRSVGWVDDYNGRLYVSVNDCIYRMNYTGTAKTLMYQVKSTEYKKQNLDYFWQVAYVGRFYFDDAGNMKYYVYDLSGANKGKSSVYVGERTADKTSPALTAKKTALTAGISSQLYLMNGLPDEEIQWKSSNTAVAKVDQYGLVTAVKKGTAVITAVCGGKKAGCTVTVSGYTITCKNSSVRADGLYYTATGQYAVTLPKPVRSGYTFVGWYTTSSLKKKITKIKKGNTVNKTIYAKWKKK